VEASTKKNKKREKEGELDKQQEDAEKTASVQKKGLQKKSRKNKAKGTKVGNREALSKEDDDRLTRMMSQMRQPSVVASVQKFHDDRSLVAKTEREEGTASALSLVKEGALVITAPSVVEKLTKQRDLEANNTNFKDALKSSFPHLLGMIVLPSNRGHYGHWRGRRLNPDGEMTGVFDVHGIFHSGDSSKVLQLGEDTEEGIVCGMHFTEGEKNNFRIQTLLPSHVHCTNVEDAVGGLRILRSLPKDWRGISRTVDMNLVAILAQQFAASVCGNGHSNPTKFVPASTSLQSPPRREARRSVKTPPTTTTTARASMPTIVNNYNFYVASLDMVEDYLPK
jgi:hypothetical protein